LGEGLLHYRPPMRRAILSSAAVLFAITCASAGVTSEQKSAAHLDSVEIARASAVPGFAVAVVKGDQIVWKDSVGLANITDQTPIDSQSQFRVGSVTKLLTAVALGRLVERGVMSLDDPVAKYVPQFKHPEITIGQLAHHLSGIRHYGRSEYINATHYDNVDAALAKFIDDPLVAPPGTRYAYSSYGYNLLGAAMERATDTPFTKLITREVLAPFHMDHTGSFDAVPAGHVVTFYDPDKEKGTSLSPAMDLSDRLPSGGYLSTAEDLGRLLIGVQKQSPALEQLLFTSGKTVDGTETHVGLAWRLATDPQGRRYVHHGGDTVGGRTFVLLYPDEGVGVVMLANESFAQLGEKEAMKIAAHFLPTQAKKP
jgi:serine beta-lactamase-like protein LACTB